MFTLNTNETKEQALERCDAYYKKSIKSIIGHFIRRIACGESERCIAMSADVDIYDDTIQISFTHYSSINIRVSSQKSSIFEIRNNLTSIIECNGKIEEYPLINEIGFCYSLIGAFIRDFSLKQVLSSLMREWGEKITQIENL